MTKRPAGKDDYIRLRLSREHKRLIENQAAAVGLSISAWLRYLALANCRPTKQEAA